MLPCPPLGTLPDPGIKPVSLASPALTGRLYTTSTTSEALTVKHPQRLPKTHSSRRILLPLRSIYSVLLYSICFSLSILFLWAVVFCLSNLSIAASLISTCFLPLAFIRINIAKNWGLWLLKDAYARMCVCVVGATAVGGAGGGGGCKWTKNTTDTIIRLLRATVNIAMSLNATPILRKKKPWRSPRTTDGENSMAWPPVVACSSFSHVWLFVTLWTVARQGRPGDFSGKNAGVDCHGLLQGIFLTQGSNPGFLHWQGDSLPLSHLGNPTWPPARVLRMILSIHFSQQI